MTASKELAVDSTSFRKNELGRKLIRHEIKRLRSVDGDALQFSPLIQADDSVNLPGIEVTWRKCFDEAPRYFDAEYLKAKNADTFSYQVFTWLKRACAELEEASAKAALEVSLAGQRSSWSSTQPAVGNCAKRPGKRLTDCGRPGRFYSL